MTTRESLESMSDERLDGLLKDEHARFTGLVATDPATEEVRRIANDIRRVWATNAIEGSTLTIDETAQLIEKGVTAGGKKFADHQDAFSTLEAIQLSRELVTEERPITQADVRTLHATVVGRTNPDIAGRYAQAGRTIAGHDDTVFFPSPAEIPALMGDYIETVNGAERGLASAGAAHSELVSIHPFQDGNGRTSRIVMNAILERDGYPAAVIDPVQHRERYIAAVSDFHQTGNDEPFNRFLKERMVESLTRANSFLERNRSTSLGADVAEALRGAEGSAGRESLAARMVANAMTNPERRARALTTIDKIEQGRAREQGRETDMQPDLDIGD